MSTNRATTPPPTAAAAAATKTSSGKPSKSLKKLLKKINSPVKSYNTLRVRNIILNQRYWAKSFSLRTTDYGEKYVLIIDGPSAPKRKTVDDDSESDSKDSDKSGAEEEEDEDEDINANMDYMLYLPRSYNSDPKKSDLLDLFSPKKAATRKVYFTCTKINYGKNANDVYPTYEFDAVDT